MKQAGLAQCGAIVNQRVKDKLSAKNWHEEDFILSKGSFCLEFVCKP